MSKHQHNFLSVDHSASERKTWWVIALCTASMFLEIGCGIRFGSLALIADGLHMSTHAFAFLVTALSYSYARKHSDDPRFVFGTGKVGDLAAFSSAIILFLIALFIMYEGLYRYLHPQTINYSEAIPVAFVGLTVNILSGVILGGGFTCCNTVEDVGSGHGHTHGHTIEHFEYDIESDNTWQHNSYLGGGGLRDHGHDHHTNCGSHTTKDQENAHHSKEHGHDHGHEHECSQDQHHHDGHSHGAAHHAHGEEVSYNSYQRIGITNDHGHDDYEDRDSTGKIVSSKHSVDNNIRAAFVHVISDAVVSVLVIIALIVAAHFANCEYLDSTAGIMGSIVILNWAYMLAVDTSANLLDLNPDMKLTHHLRERLESDGSVVNDLHVWRLGPGHLGSIISVTPPSDSNVLGEGRNEAYYRQRIKGFKALSHITIEIGQLN